MTSREIRIETGRIGLRGKTWAVLFITIAQGANFGLSCTYWLANNTLAITGLVGWLVITTLGAIAGAVSEARRKPLTNAYTLRLKSRTGDNVEELEQRLEQIEKTAGGLSAYIGTARD